MITRTKETQEIFCVVQTAALPSSSRLLELNKKDFVYKFGQTVFVPVLFLSWPTPGTSFTPPPEMTQSTFLVLNQTFLSNTWLQLTFPIAAWSGSAASFRFWFPFQFTDGALCVSAAWWWKRTGLAGSSWRKLDQDRLDCPVSIWSCRIQYTTRTTRVRHQMNLPMRDSRCLESEADRNSSGWMHHLLVVTFGHEQIQGALSAWAFFPPRFFSKSCSFLAISREKPLFWANCGLRPPGVKTLLAPWPQSWIFSCWFSLKTTSALKALRVEGRPDHNDNGDNNEDGQCDSFWVLCSQPCDLIVKTELVEDFQLVQCLRYSLWIHWLLKRIRTFKPGKILFRILPETWWTLFCSCDAQRVQPTHPRKKDIKCHKIQTKSLYLDIMFLLLYAS